MPSYPTLPDLPENFDPVEEPEKLSNLADMLYQQIRIASAIVPFGALPEAYKEALALSEGEQQAQRFFRVGLQFAEHVADIYVDVDPSKRGLAYYYPDEPYNFFVRFLAGQVEQAQLLEEHPTWISYSRHIGNTEVEAVYETAMRYPLWQQEGKTLQNFFGEGVFRRLLKSDPHA